MADQMVSPVKKEISETDNNTSLRVNVTLLDTLMNLAGELVLSRNQLLQGISTANVKTTELSGQRIDMITSELQEAIMRTRMQPIGNILNKFTRVVRDLSQQLGKSVNLTIEGKEVELDKTIIEAINDPLTHLIRNSVDHGIELPDERARMGKPSTGQISIKAFHEAGQVNILISDDGRGLDPEKISAAALSKKLITPDALAQMNQKKKMELIFLPGFSTAAQVTDVSGRGVGMDVVTTNIETLGGVIELESKPEKGTDILIKLPLTLAIIPSQIMQVGGERYAVPQVNLNELLRIPAAEIKDRIEKVGDASVVRLRGELLPLLDLAQMLGIDKSYLDPFTGLEFPDRRHEIADRRSIRHMVTDFGPETVDEISIRDIVPRKNTDRRKSRYSAVNIAVVSAGAFKYGLVVDQLLDSEEIVVKPVGRHLKKYTAYAGATIMGDGKVALILDIANLAQAAQLSTVSETAQTIKSVDQSCDDHRDRAALLTFKNGDQEHFAAPLTLVQRIERVQASDIEKIGSSKVIQYRGGALPLIELADMAGFDPLPEKNFQEVVVFRVRNREIGLLVSPPVDAIELVLNIDESALKQNIISGSMAINGHTTLLIDIFEMVKTAHPDWFVRHNPAPLTNGETVLFAEDSAFFREKVTRFMEEDGIKVISAEDGLVAWKLLEDKIDEIDLVVTDLEMPNLDGFELTKKIKADQRFSHLSVVALTSLSSETHKKKGKLAGIDDYQIKLDREKLITVVRRYLEQA